MPIARTYHKKCRTCGRPFTVVIGDCIDSYELMKIFQTKCDRCKAEELKADLKKLFKKG